MLLLPGHNPSLDSELGCTLCTRLPLRAVHGLPIGLHPQVAESPRAHVNAHQPSSSSGAQLLPLPLLRRRPPLLPWCCRRRRRRCSCRRAAVSEGRSPIQIFRCRCWPGLRWAGRLDPIRRRCQHRCQRRQACDRARVGAASRSSQCAAPLHRRRWRGRRKGRGRQRGHKRALPRRGCRHRRRGRGGGAAQKLSRMKGWP